MNQTEQQAMSIEALKSFNNTIVTSRLYPPEAPQVASAVDRGYKSMKLYLRQYGDLQYALQGGMPFLCGQPLNQETVDSFANLVVYRQLRLLGLSKLVVSSEMDRFAFGQLLQVFNASVEKIKNEGGGLKYITNLGLAGYFPDESGESGEKNLIEGHADESRTRKPAAVRPELVACLFGKDTRPVIESELQKKMVITESAIDILVAGAASILQGIQKKKMIVASQDFPLMVAKAGALIGKDKQTEVALGLAKVLDENLKEPALGVLLVQEYSAGSAAFGSTLYDGLVGFLSTEKLAGIMRFFKEQLIKARRVGGADSPQVQCLGKALMLLMNSKKGKHFLGAEKARIIIHEGEKERKKRRLEAGVQGFLQGNTSLLKSEELVDYLPHAVRQLQKKTGDAEVSILLRHLTASLQTESEDVRQPLLKSIITIGEDFLAAGHWSHVDLLLKPLIEQVRKGGGEDALLEKAFALLQQVMQKSWQDGENDRGDGILSFFHQIRSGQLSFSPAIKAIVAKVQDKGIRRAYLPQLLAQCLAAPHDERLSYRLILQGPVVLRFLVESLINTDNAPDRIKIIDLLTGNPHFLPAVIHERLQEHMPWYGKRNLIKLLGETGTEADAENILPYLRHDDFRVQRETFLTLYKIGGRNRKQLLLRALEESSESIKVQVVKALANSCDAEVAGKLVDLLASHEQFSEQNRNDLLLQLMDTLGRCPYPVAHKGVDAFLQTRGQRATKKISEQVWSAAEKALKFLQDELQETRKKHIQASQLRKNALKQAAKMSKTAVMQRVITGLPQEHVVRSLLARGDNATAGKQLLELIERAARLRNFVQAEKLREWLAEIDSTALGPLLLAAEIIDREKIAAIDKSHLEIWSGLYDILTTDEFSAVYHALKHKKYENEEIIVNQGVLQGSLFFINSGKVKLYFGDQGSEVLVDTMEKGQIFGAGAFFEASVWTISVAAVGTVEISVLKLDALQQWAEDFPGLDAKLQLFCKKFENIEDFIKRTSNDRRQYKRYRIAGKAATTLLDDRGRSIDIGFMAELCDISEGGLSFLLRISQKENARLLLGRKMLLHLPRGMNATAGITLAGDILAVKNTYAVENDYSLHMKFDTVMDRRQLHDVVTLMREESAVIE